MEVTMPSSDTKPHAVLQDVAVLEATPDVLEHFKGVIIDRMVDDKLQFLVVEDVVFTRKVLHDLLMGSGSVHAVGSATDGWNAYLKTAHDIVFIDIGLEDMLGHDLAKRIRDINPHAYIVMVTGQNTIDEVKKAVANHTNGYILKPFNKKKIHDCIDDYILKHKSKRAAEIQIEKRS